jgi:hypothetical protein
MDIMTLALCRNSDFLLRASQPEPPAASCFSRSPSKNQKPVEIRPAPGRYRR